MESAFESEVIVDQHGLKMDRTTSTNISSFTSTSTLDGSSTSTVSVLKMCFLLLLMPISSIMGNLISIGPGAYPSNLTLGDDHSGILVLGSCEFMHNGQLISINVYVATADWLIIQIWRPVDDVIGKMALVHSKMVQPNQTDTIVQVWYQNDSVHVHAGDKIGLMKVNSTLPVPYISNPKMTANIWHSSHKGETPDDGQVLTFDEYGFPYHFSLTVTFRADRPNIYDILQRTNKSSHFRKESYFTNNSSSSKSGSIVDDNSQLNSGNYTQNTSDVMPQRHVRYRYDNLPMELLSSSSEDYYQDLSDMTYATKLSESKSAESGLSSENEIIKPNKLENELKPSKLSADKQYDHTADHMTAINPPTVQNPPVASTQTTKVVTMSDDKIDDQEKQHYTENNSYNISLGEQSVLSESNFQSEANASTVVNGNHFDNDKMTRDVLKEIPTSSTQAATTQYTENVVTRHSDNIMTSHSDNVVTKYSEYATTEHSTGAVATSSSIITSNTFPLSDNPGFMITRNTANDIVTDSATRTVVKAITNAVANAITSQVTAPFVVTDSTEKDIVTKSKSQTTQTSTSVSLFPFFPSTIRQSSFKTTSSPKRIISNMKKTKINSVSQH